MLDITAAFKSQYRTPYFIKWGIQEDVEEIKASLYKKGLLLKNGGITPKGRELRNSILNNTQTYFIGYEKFKHLFFNNI